MQQRDDHAGPNYKLSQAEWYELLICKHESILEFRLNICNNAELHLQKIVHSQVSPCHSTLFVCRNVTRIL